MTPIALQLSIHKKGPDECWPWLGSSRGGYGVFTENGKTVGAHVRVLELKLGRKLKPKHKACHTCDNPPCCNPRHLFEGTHLQNMADMRAKGRRVGKNQGTVHGRSKMTEELVASLRYRWCRGIGTKEELIAESGVCRSVFYSMLTGRTWTHVPGALANVKYTYNSINV